MFNICFLSFFYSFNSDSNFDPWDDCSIWAYYYFFYSKKLKRIVFFTYRAVRYVLVAYITYLTLISVFILFSLLSYRKDDYANQQDDMINDTGYTSFDIELI